MLNMSSASPTAAPTADAPDDRTARARIRDAAMRLIGEHGFRAATVRAIADAADVSPALVVHHFGSKQGLREAVDEHLVTLVRERKLAAITGSMMPTGDEYAGLADEFLPALRYLARALADGAEVGLHLYERLHADAVGYLTAGVDAGVLRPTDDEHVRAVVLLNAGLATLLLEPHVERVLGDGDVPAAVRTAPAVLDLYTDGLFTDDRFRRAWRGESGAAARASDPDPPTGPDHPIGPDHPTDPDNPTGPDHH